MKKIETYILIQAPIEKVWTVLTDFERYPDWNPFIRQIDGTPQHNEKLSVTIQPPGQKTMTFRPQITHMKDYCLEWVGHLGCRGIFDGQHRFELQSYSAEQVKFLHSEIFSGLLSTPIFYLIHKSTKVGFEKMNESLKTRSEI